MTSWYFSSIIALLLLGAQRFFYKVAAERKCPTAWVTFSFMSTVTLLSAVLFVIQQRHEPNVGYLVTVALINSAAFLLATVAHIEALKYIPANIVYPLVRLNVALVAVFSILYFNDHVSFPQGVGLLIAVIAMIILTRQMQGETGQEKRRRAGFIFVFLALVGGFAASISSKFAAVHTDKLAFMALSYLAGMVGSLGIKRALAFQESAGSKREALGIGITMGLFNFAGFYAFLVALEHGPLSLVATIVGMHFVIAIVLSAIIYREKMPPAGVVGLILTIVSIVLLRL